MTRRKVSPLAAVCGKCIVRRAMVEDIQFMLDSGRRLEEIPAAVGVSSSRTLERKLFRWGENVLAGRVRPSYENADRDVRNARR